jgi:hypothetical protein
MLNLYDAVERAAIKKMIPRLELWKLVGQGIRKGSLVIRYPNLRGGDGSVTWPAWITGFLAAVDRDNDPHSFGAAKYLREIIVAERKFDAWILKALKAPRGPRRGMSGYASADRKHFPAIAKLLKNGDARGAHGAALMLAKQGKIKGASPESAAKRVASRYLESKK